MDTLSDDPDFTEPIKLGAPAYPGIAAGLFSLGYEDADLEKKEEIHEVGRACRRYPATVAELRQRCITA